MANKNFTQFELQSPITLNDYLVGFKQDESNEIRTQVKDIQQAVVGNIIAKLSSVEIAMDTLGPADYVSPLVTLTKSDPTAVYEIGTEPVFNFELDFVQYDAGDPTGYFLRRNGILVRQDSVPFVYQVQGGTENRVVAGVTTFTGTVEYQTGPAKLNIIGNPGIVGRILAGSVSQSISYTGRYRIFYGSVSSLPSNLRNLPLNVFDNQNTITTGAIDQNTIAFAAPAVKSLVRVITQANENITNNFTQTNVTVNDAAGQPVSYKLWTTTTTTPLNIPITITLAN